MTVGEALDYYLSDLRVRAKASTLRVCGIHATTLRRFLAGADAAELTVPELNRMVMRLRQEGRADTGINGVLRVLRAALRLAEADRLIERAVKVKLLRETRKIPSVLTQAQVERLHGAAAAEAGLAILFAAFAGLRHQEIAHLTWPDVSEREVRVTAKTDWTPKAHAERAVPVHPTLAAAVFKWGPKPEGYVFRSRDFTDPVREAFQRAGLYDLAQKPGLHQLRRTFASRLLAGGADIETVRELGGWSSLATVQRYVASSTPQKRSAVERLIGW